MSVDALALLERHLDAVDAMGLEDEPPPAPDLTGLELGPEDLARARALLVRLEATEARLVGLRTRVLGEITGGRRSRVDPPRPSPRVLDTRA